MTYWDTDTCYYVKTCRADADYARTQMFFYAEVYLRVRTRVTDAGFYRPIIPGLMTATHAKQIERFASLSNAAFPPELSERLHAVEDDKDEIRRVGVEAATVLCQRLLDEGVPGLHFITLNTSSATREIYQRLGLRDRD